jgi:hypothetical protein
MTRREVLTASLSVAVLGPTVGCGDPPGNTDAGATDSGTPDAGTPDSGTPDSGTPDAGAPDSGTPDAGTPDGGTARTCTETIPFNHGHDLVLPYSDVEAGVEKTYDIQGVALHLHSVTLTSAHFAQLRNGQPVTVTSTVGDLHSHEVTVTCA